MHVLGRPGVTQIDRVVEVVEETLKGNRIRLLGKKKTLPRLDLPKVRKNKHVEIVPLSTGCLGRCTYCKTKHARGELGSYDPDALVSRVQHIAKDPLVSALSSCECTEQCDRCLSQTNRGSAISF